MDIGSLIFGNNTIAESGNTSNKILSGRPGIWKERLSSKLQALEHRMGPE